MARGRSKDTEGRVPVSSNGPARKGRVEATIRVRIRQEAEADHRSLNHRTCKER